MNGAASGLIDAFKDAYGSGTDWDQIPSGGTSWFKFGSGGIKCWGTLCGIPNGCCNILNLINLWSPLASDVLGHYSETEFPPTGLHDLFNDPTYGWDTGYAPEPVPDDEVLAYTTAFSPLCHVSISKWCRAAMVDLNDTTDYATSHKNDRCGKICAHMAGFTAELINYYLLHTAIEDPYAVSGSTESCIGCHWKVDKNGDPPAQCGLMDCSTCHNPTIGDYMTDESISIMGVWMSDQTTDDPKWSFSIGDPMRAHVVFTCNQGVGGLAVTTKQSWCGLQKTGGGIIYNNINKADGALNSAEHHWTWDFTCPALAKSPGRGRTQIGLKAYEDPTGPFLEAEMKHVDFYIVP